MRVVSSYKNTVVRCLDESGQGNACHRYHVETIPVASESPVAIVAQIDFQNGPIMESGVNGCQNEDLISVVIDRLQGFQSGPFACRENALALAKLEEALHWLMYRTKKRVERGVEGKNII